MFCSGMAPLIRAVLSKLIGDEESAKIEIIANDVILKPEGKWEIQFRHPSRCVSSLSYFDMNNARICERCYDISLHTHHDQRHRSLTALMLPDAPLVTAALRTRVVSAWNAVNADHVFFK